MRSFIFFIIILTGNCAFSHTSAKQKDSVYRVAVLPANVNLVLLRNDSKKISDEQVRTTAREMAFIIQAEIHHWFSERQKKYRYNIELQDTRSLNEALFAGGLSYEDYQKLSPDSLARLLHTDAVVFCNSTIKKQLTNTEAAAIDALSLAATIFLPVNLIPVVGTTTAKFDVGLNNSSSSINLWKMDELPILFRGQSMDGLLEKTLKFNARHFPYRFK